MTKKEVQPGRLHLLDIPAVFPEIRSGRLGDRELMGMSQVDRGRDPVCPAAVDIVQLRLADVQGVGVGSRSSRAGRVSDTSCRLGGQIGKKDGNRMVVSGLVSRRC